MSDVFRQEHTPLSDEQKEEGKVKKEKAQDIFDYITSQVSQQEISERSRLINIGKTHLEIAIAMICKGVFSKQN